MINSVRSCMCFITELCTWRANFASCYDRDCHPCQVGGLLNPAVSAIPEKRVKI